MYRATLSRVTSTYYTHAYAQFHLTRFQLPYWDFNDVKHKLAARIL